MKIVGVKPTAAPPFGKKKITANDVEQLYPRRGVPGRTKFSTATEDIDRVFKGYEGIIGRDVDVPTYDENLGKGQVMRTAVRQSRGSGDKARPATDFGDGITTGTRGAGRNR